MRFKSRGFQYVIGFSTLCLAALLIGLMGLINPAYARAKQQDNPTVTALQATIFFLETKQAASAASNIDATTAAQQATIAALQGSDGITPTAPQNAQAGTLTVGKEAVVTADGNEVYVFAGPQRSSSRLATLLTGHHVLIIGGPTNADGYVWWQVQLIENRQGWVVEGDSTSAWIQPSTDESKVQVLNGLIASNIFIGARVKAGPDTSVSIVVRSDPSPAGQVIGMIDKENTAGTIFDGPLNDTTGPVPVRWWKIRLANGAIGWVKDGEQQLNFLEPVYPSDTVTNVRGDHIKVGDTIRATSSGDGMRLRQSPMTNSPAVTTLGVGVNAKVLAGPTEGQGFVWWQIERSDGLRGWIATAPGWTEVYTPTR